MQWSDQAVFLSAQPHGETAVIASLLTREQGRHAGLISGGQSRRMRPHLQAGNIVEANWNARLSDHLGHLSLEVVTPTSAPWLDTPEILALIAAACAVTEAALPERQPMPALFEGLLALFSLKDPALWGPSYVKWELGVLASLGYGLNTACCAITGAKEGLAFVSPRTGRAVTANAAAPYIEKLLPLPAFICGAGDWDEAEILKGLELTGHFLSRHVFAHPQNRRLVPLDGMLPLARQRLASFYSQKADPDQKVA